MIQKSVIICLVFTTLCGVAVAGPVEECALTSPSLTIVRSCTPIINSPNFGSDQKALSYKYRGVVRLSAGAAQLAIADSLRPSGSRRTMRSHFQEGLGARFIEKDFPR